MVIGTRVEFDEGNQTNVYTHAVIVKLNHYTNLGILVINGKNIYLTSLNKIRAASVTSLSRRNEQSIRKSLFPLASLLKATAIP